MTRLVIVLLMGLLCMHNVSYAGNGDLTVGGTLEMTSNSTGFLPPRMTTSARGSISPSPGMLIYNTDNDAYNYYTSSGWITLTPSLPVHDNTGATSDYDLAAGETAKITYTSSTSIPLHIKTTQGIYELYWIQPYTTSLSPDALVALRPNNTTLPAGSIVFSENRQDYIPNVSPGGGAGAYWRDGNMPVFTLGYNYTFFAKATISTFTNSKHIIGDIHRISTPSSPILQSYSIYETWKDVSTVWSSLGTLVLPYPQSGTIIIRRIF